MLEGREGEMRSRSKQKRLRLRGGAMNKTRPRVEQSQEMTGETR